VKGLLKCARHLPGSSTVVAHLVTGLAMERYRPLEVFLVQPRARRLAVMHRIGMLSACAE